MTQTIYSDRSRVESFQRCNRLRFLEYHQDGIGLSPAQKPLPLAVGGAEHVGQAVLLWEGQQAVYGYGSVEAVPLAVWREIEEHAVDAAIANLSQYRNALALDPTEALAQASAVTVPDDQMRQQLAESLGMSVEDAGLDSLLTTQVSGRKAFDDYLWQEQSGLVEGMVRAYARRRLRPLLEECEVLEVEREGTWLLAHVHPDKYYEDDRRDGADIVFCSRPDALLRSRSDNSLYLMSFKTAATWDRRKELDAAHDMQGLSEGVEVERRYAGWWRQIQEKRPFVRDSYLTSEHAIERNQHPSVAVAKYLMTLPAPPRILGIRYEYLLKGYRGEDKDLSARFGFKVWSQRSHLVRRYRAVSLPQKGQAAFNLGDYCWSFDYLKDDGSETKLYYGHWKSEPVDNVKSWIDLLDDSQEAMSAFDSTVGMEPRALGWKSRGQALGFTKEHPLDAIFIPPITCFRQDDDLRDFMEEIEEQEVEIAENVALIEATTDEGERRSLLNRKFRKTRKACSYPSECVFTKVCYGGEDIKRDPMATGKFVQRVANHLAEKEALTNISHMSIVEDVE